MLKIELELSVNVREVHTVQQSSLLLHLEIKRSARHRRIQHELVKVRFMADRALDFVFNIFRRMMFQADDG